MNRKNVLTTLFIAIILLSLVTLIYAFFVAGEISSTDQTATVETGTMALTGCRGPAFWGNKRIIQNNK